MQKILDKYRLRIYEHPLIALLTIAFLFRMLAVIFAKGFMAPDDHFLTIEIADGWLKGINHWYTDKPPMRGILYPYIVTASMWILKQVSIVRPEVVMFFIRLSHGLWSLITVPLIYLAVKKYSDDRTAFTAGLIGAIFYITPFMSVRNLPEFFCQPVILAGLILADFSFDDEKAKSRNWLLSGLLLGLGFMLRYQNSLIPAGVFFYLAIRKRWRSLIPFTIGVSITIAVEICMDYLSYGSLQFPFVNSLIFQSGHVHAYVTNPFYTHFATILLAFIPPFSFVFIWWCYRGVKKMPIMFWATLVFLVFHSIIPQKQERFIFPILPELIVLGMIGSYGSLLTMKSWMKVLWKWFWTVNILILIIVTFNYSQKARVESFIKLSKIPDLSDIIEINTEHPMNPPKYYLNKDADIHLIHRWEQLDSVVPEVYEKHLEGNNGSCYIVIFNHKPLQYYLDNLYKRIPAMEEVYHIKPSLVDALLHMMNPLHNHSKEAYIYKWVFI